MTPKETQTEGIASLIAMLELMFALQARLLLPAVHRLFMVHCTVQPAGHWTHSWPF